ncbi:hypothetical protein LCGC14_0403420 [marine sediment metagenome]|uniref:C1q domain-containing protein n=1 Tax=marine sediment metagenome TaxID=412755 RepID=A0A0F9T1R9_9ZZZZ
MKRINWKPIITRPSVIATIFCLTFWGVVYATTFSFTYDTATPAGSDDPAEADDRMREIKAAVQEREAVNHYWPLTGTEVSDADAGEHLNILYHAPIAATPTVAADHGDLRIKDVNSIAELHYTDESENELQLSSMGNNLSRGQWLTSSDVAGTGSVNLIRADTNDVAVLPDNSQTATNAAPTSTAGIANKKYVDGINSVFARLFKSASTQSISSTAATKVTLDGESFDSGSIAGSNKITPAVIGYYQVNGCVECANVGDFDTITVLIFKNGASVAQMTIDSGGSSVKQSPLVSDIIFLDADDFVELYIKSTDSSYTVNNGETKTYISLCKLANSI